MLVLTVWQERRTAEPIMPPRLFANQTFVITSLAGFVVGVAMFGAIIFLPQYLQIVKGESPTASGLLTLPLMVGLLATSIGSGRLITHTGRYKIFPVLGLLIAAVGLTLMSRLSVDTSLWLAGVFMFITGAGIGMVMQVLVLATQNAVPHADLGVATSGATFFRSLGGAMGVAVFGALLTHRLRDTIPAQLRAAGVDRRPDARRIRHPGQRQTRSRGCLTPSISQSPPGSPRHCRPPSSPPYRSRFSGSSSCCSCERRRCERPGDTARARTSPPRSRPPSIPTHISLTRKTGRGPRSPRPLGRPPHRR